jgi:glycerol-3-phosphate dehydrogenase (NAD(P)+)
MSGISIIGATTWGGTLASLIAANGMPVRVWANTLERASARVLAREHSPSSSGLPIEFTHDPDLAAELCDVAIFAVPAQSLRRTGRLFRDRLSPSSLLISAAKGLEADTGKRMTQVLAEEMATGDEQRLAALSGPNLSKEINLGLPAVTIVASKSEETARRMASLLSSASFSVQTCNDVEGVEICGALKNVIALGAGMTDGLGLGSNAKAALVTVGWQEAIELGKTLGAREETFYGFAGLGDLITTCISPLSRNHHVGYELATGKTLAMVLAAMSNVAEGVDTAAATYLLIRKMGLRLPLMDAIYKVLHGQMAPGEISRHFLNGHGPAC